MAAMAGILFLCVANSARSQLAEAIARDLEPELDIWSAGSEPTHVRPQVRRVLEEKGFDDKGLRSKSLFEVEMDEIDVIVTLCPVRSSTCTGPFQTPPPHQRKKRTRPFAQLVMSSFGVSPPC